MFTSLVVLLKLGFSRGINLLMFYQLNCFLYSLDRFDLEVIFPNLVFLRQVNNCLFDLGKRQQNILFIGWFILHSSSLKYFLVSICVFE